MTEPNPSRFDLEPVMLLGPGPSSVSPRVLQAAARPLLGYLDDDFRAMLAEESGWLRASFATENAVTFALSGTGMAGMEAAFANLLERGDRLLVGVNGFFGERMVEVAARHGAEIHRVDAEWGRALDPAALASKAREVRPKLVAVVHAETSTGCLQPLAPLAAAARESGALFLADCVTSIGGAAIELDAAGVDAAYAGSQKCLGAPPGLSPVSFSPRAMDAVRARKTPASSWYHDLAALERYYFGAPPAYHHTPSNTLHYALLEALRALHRDEGAAATFARHRSNHVAVVAGLRALGLKLLVPEDVRAPMLNAVLVPDGVDDAKVRARLRAKDRIEIGAGLGKLRGRVLRIGLMGHSSRFANVVTVLAALAEALLEQGYRCSAGAAVEAANANAA